MTLRKAIEQYIAWRQAHGTKFHSGAVLLHLFLNSIDGEINCDAVTDEQVCAFLAGKGPLRRRPRTRRSERSHGKQARLRTHRPRCYPTSSAMPEHGGKTTTRSSKP